LSLFGRQAANTTSESNDRRRSAATAKSKSSVLFFPTISFVKIVIIIIIIIIIIIMADDNDAYNEDDDDSYDEDDDIYEAVERINVNDGASQQSLVLEVRLVTNVTAQYMVDFLQRHQHPQGVVNRLVLKCGMTPEPWRFFARTLPRRLCQNWL
jgi:hypothetical protein